MTPEQAREWDEWMKDRPESVRAVARIVNPYTLYVNKTRRDQRVVLASIYENGTVLVVVPEHLNLGPFSFSVFGVDPANLEPTMDTRPFYEWVTDNPIGSTAKVGDGK